MPEHGLLFLLMFGRFSPSVFDILAFKLTARSWTSLDSLFSFQSSDGSRSAPRPIFSAAAFQMALN